jgi:nitrite reductase (NADH) small subunit
MQFVSVCRVADIPVGLGRSFLIRGERIALFRSRAGKVFAVSDRCPHRGGPLSDGMVVGDQVVCPLHAFRFHADNGACDQQGVCGIPTYPVDVGPDEFVRVGVEVA